jgi:hypothetical protein
MKILGEFFALLVGFLPIILFMLLFNWLRRSAKKLHPRPDGSSLEFFVAPGMRILLRLVLFLLAAFTILVLVAIRSEGGSFYAILIPLSVLVAILLAMPRTVTVDGRGIRQHRWIRKDREIAWHEIAWMRRGFNTGVTYVKSKNGGRPVSFSPLLVGQSRFEREVRAHAGDRDDLCDS